MNSGRSQIIWHMRGAGWSLGVSLGVLGGEILGGGGGYLRRRGLMALRELGL